ncbi:MAG: TetR/AcrR family transcriptional regulator, partial [Proteobacteria bacterium]|nr:TetR/AcrR family transcriptional regulator [Pseudomonadota bacterium]
SVGLITTSVTYYYRRKEDLAAACLLRTLAAIDALVDEAETAGTPEQRLADFLQLYFAMLAEIAEGERAELINFYDVLALTGRHVDSVFDAFNDLFRRFRHLFRAEGDAVFTRTEQNARAHLVFALVTWSRAWVRRYEPDDYPRAARWMTDILIRGIGAPGAQWAPLDLTSGAPAVERPGEAFLRAATELVNEQGYHGASVEKISARLSVTKGSFYHHNETKHDLVADCFERSFDVIRGALRSATATEDVGGWDRITSAAHTLVRHQLSEHGPLLRYTALAAVPETIRPDLFAAMQRLSERFAGLIVDGIADGSIRPIDPMVAAQLINGMINAAAELKRWAPEADEGTASELFARPLFFGLWSRPEQ